MDKSSHIFRSIVAATDFSRPARKALQAAVWTAQRCQASLTVVHAVRDVAGSLAVIGYGDSWQPTLEEMMNLQDEYRSEGERRLKALLASQRSKGMQIKSEVLTGAPYEEIIRAAGSLSADLVIVGTRGQSALKRFLVGSTATRLARACPCPVWIVRPQQSIELRSILVPLDFSQVSEKALSLAASLSLAVGAELHLLHVCDVDDLHMVPPLFDQAAADLEHERRHDRQSAVERLERSLQCCAATHPSASLHAAQGAPWQVIGSMADKLHADLVVMGSVGRSGLSGMLIGNTAEKTLHASQHSVLIVKPDGFSPPSMLSEARRALHARGNSHGGATRADEVQPASAGQTELSGAR
jgi:nucleotide-binding universal stress UspA family protein